MDKNLPLRKTVYTKEQLGKLVDADFTDFTSDPAVDQNDIAEFFRLYNELFFDIPLNGDVNSHEFLLKRSSEVARVDQILEDITPLLDEIASLRRQLLDANRRVLELELQQAAQGNEISLEEFLALQEQIVSLQSQLADANATIAELRRQLAEGSASTISAAIEGGFGGEGQDDVATAEATQLELTREQEVVTFVEVENYGLARDIVDQTSKGFLGINKKRRERKKDTDRMNRLIRAARAKTWNDVPNSPANVRDDYIVRGFNKSIIKSRVICRLSGNRIEFELKD